ncbi:hypothetical protein D3248_04980 [Leucobacter zeae]|nr:hypothetical protein [Leucobacter zeae]
MEMKLNLTDAKRAAARTRDPMRALHRRGVRGRHAFVAALALLGLSWLVRLFSGRDGAGSVPERLGHMLGEAAPMLMLVGLGLERRE